MLQINKRQFKKWIAALDSEEYKQGKYALENSAGYCCLGVGCKVTIPANMLNTNAFGYISGSLPTEQAAAPSWLRIISDNFFAKTGKSLDALNDDEGFTFPEIATLLELVYVYKIVD